MGRNQIPENLLASFIELRDIVHHAFYHDGKVSGDVLNALRRANTVLKKIKTDDSSVSVEDYFVKTPRKALECVRDTIEPQGEIDENGNLTLKNIPASVITNAILKGLGERIK